MKLINSLQNLIEQASKKPANSQTVSLLQRHEQRSKGDRARIILIDVSASMAESVGAETKISLLKKALNNLALDVKLYEFVAFGSFPEDCCLNDIPRPSGSTAMHLAFEHIKNRNPTYTLVISDGQPDSESAALLSADKISGKIDVLYIGAENDYDAISFMYKLAGRTGGKVVAKDIKQAAQLLGPEIKALLK